MAEAGVGSRRYCETLIRDGRVVVDGQTVTVQGLRVDPVTSNVRLDGRTLRAERKIYLALNKPAGVLCTSRDTHGRKQLADLLPDAMPRLYSVGRLDKDSAGLLLLTNDGDFSLRLTHPRYKILKSYLVEVEGKVAPEDVRRLRRGVTHDGERLRAEKISNIRAERGQTRLLMVLAQGRKRQVRRMMTVVGHPVRRLTRVAIGQLRLGKLKSGQWRYLTDDEVHMLTPQ
jgi:23S rRNA pseudouridine2605 synthase